MTLGKGILFTDEILVKTFGGNGLELRISNVIFEGPYDIDRYEIPAGYAGIYAIVDHTDDGKYHLLDIGQSGDAACRLANHDRRRCWDTNKTGKLEAYILWTPNSKGWNKDSRCEFESKVRNEYRPMCGKI